MTKSKWIEGLDCEATARAGISFVLRAKLDEMCQLREAALDFTDIEGVHKMRVASRRLRSALRDFQPYLSKPVSPRRLKAMARALGAVRDEDVAIEMIGGLVAEADEEAREGIERIADERRARREKARERLTAKLSVGALGELREKFAVQLSRAAAESRARKAAATGTTSDATTDAATDATKDAATDATTTAPTAETTGATIDAVTGATTTAEDARVSASNDGGVAAPDDERVVRFADVGGEIVRELFRELKQSSRSLYRPFEVEPLHEMRIRAKRLRYAIEIFTQCWGEPVAPYAEEIAKLQQHLGELHDCDVWIEELGKRLARRARRKRGAARRQEQAAERRAAFWLLNHFTKARAKHYAKALALWDTWESMDFESSLAASVEEARRAAESHARPTAGAGVAGREGAAEIVDKDAAGAVDGDGAAEVADEAAGAAGDPRTLQA